MSTDSEKIFVGRHALEPFPDDIILPDSDFLRAGECEFSYISALGDEPISSLNTLSATPLLIAHFVPGTDQLDPVPYGITFGYLRGDNSVTTGKIHKDGSAFVRGTQKDFFETGPDSHWGEKPPKIHHPLPYRVRDAPNPIFTSSPGFILFLILASGPIIHYLPLKLFSSKEAHSVHGP